MNQNITPGEWKIIEGIDNDHEECLMIDSNDGINDDYVIAVLYGPDADYNAPLIAAAPDLLEALQVCFTALQTYGKHPIIDTQVIAAINKATNQTK